MQWNIIQPLKGNEVQLMKLILDVNYTGEKKSNEILGHLGGSVS